MMNEPVPHPFWLEGFGRFSFTVQPYEIRNALGVVTAVADEYLVIGADGKQIRLYKTKDGSWYEPGDSGHLIEPALAKALKSTLERLMEDES